LSTSDEFYYDDLTMTSFINIRHGNVAVEIIPQGTRNSLWAKEPIADVDSLMQ